MLIWLCVVLWQISIISKRKLFLLNLCLTHLNYQRLGYIIKHKGYDKNMSVLASDSFNSCFHPDLSWNVCSIEILAKTWSPMTVYWSPSTTPLSLTLIPTTWFGQLCLILAQLASPIYSTMAYTIQFFIRRPKISYFTLYRPHYPAERRLYGAVFLCESYTKMIIAKWLVFNLKKKHNCFHLTPWQNEILVGKITFWSLS